ADYPGFDQDLVEMHRLGLLGEIFPALAAVTTEEIKKRVEPIAFFPNEYHAILGIMELFPKSSLDEQLAIVRYLKAGTLYERLVEFIYLGRKMVEKEQDQSGCPFDWSHFYANPYAK